MKFLRNIGIYYILLTIIAVIFTFISNFSLIFIPLIPVLVLGIIFLFIYFFMAKGVLKNKLNFSNKYTELISFTLYIFPIVFYCFVIWFPQRTYDQIVVLPKDYEGVVAILYNKPDGDQKKWIGGFLGIGASRLIKVNSKGISENQFTFHNNSIPLLGIDQTYHNNGGLKVYYEDDLSNEISFGASGQYNSLSPDICEKEITTLFFTEHNQYPFIVFVVTKPENYYKYFMNNNEKIIWWEKEQSKNNFYQEIPDHKLTKNFRHYEQLTI